MRRVALIVGMLLLTAGTLLRVLSAEPKKLVVYAPNTTYSVDVIDHKGTDYVGVVELLEPLGKVEARPDGKAWVLDFSNGSVSVRARFRDGKRDVELPNRKIKLFNDFFSRDGRGYVPLNSLQELVSKITGSNAQLHSSTRHLYLTAVRYTYELKKNPARLVLTFTVPVTPKIVAEGTTLRLEFTRDAVMSTGTDFQEFHDPIIKSAEFAETTQGAEYTIRGVAPMVVNSSDNGRMLTISTAAAPTTAAPTTTTAIVPPATPTTSTATPPKPANPNSPPKPAFTVIIDAAHGGSDTGATLAANVLEKDVTLALSRKIVHELQNHGVQATLLRNGDATVSPEQRAVMVNTSHVSIYVTVHASTIGRGVRVFTSLMAPTPVVAGKRAFVPWDQAQSQYLDRSSALSGSIAFECNRKQLNVKALQGAVMPLNNIATAAVAIEVAPDQGGVASLSATDYTQNVAVAVANGIAALKPAETEKKP